MALRSGVARSLLGGVRNGPFYRAACIRLSTTKDKAEAKALSGSGKEPSGRIDVGSTADRAS
jgi:hypothetical protein